MMPSPRPELPALANADGWQLFLGGYCDGLFLDDHVAVGGTATLKTSF